MAAELSGVEGNCRPALFQYYSILKLRFFKLLQSDRVEENLNRLGGMRYNPRLASA